MQAFLLICVILFVCVFGGFVPVWVVCVRACDFVCLIVFVTVCLFDRVCVSVCDWVFVWLNVTLWVFDRGKHYFPANSSPESRLPTSQQTNCANLKTPVFINIFWKVLQVFFRLGGEKYVKELNPFWNGLRNILGVVKNIPEICVTWRSGAHANMLCPPLPQLSSKYEKHNLELGWATLRTSKLFKTKTQRTPKSAF